MKKKMYSTECDECPDAECSDCPQFWLGTEQSKRTTAGVRVLDMVEIDDVDGRMYELMVRIREAVLDVRRPRGMTAEQAYRRIAEVNPQDALMCKRAALAALEFFHLLASRAKGVM